MQQDQSIDNMAFPFSFEILSKSILSLFELEPIYDRYYMCEKILDADDKYFFIGSLTRLTSFIGEIDDFHKWLQPKLNDFFEDFDKHFFTTNDRMNRRRLIAYDSIIKFKLCKRLPFKKQMMRELDLDIESFIKYAEEVYGDYTYFEEAGAEEDRRLLFFSCIKNYVHRLFFISEEH